MKDFLFGCLIGSVVVATCYLGCIAYTLDRIARAVESVAAEVSK